MYLRRSALHSELEKRKPVWGTLHGMEVPLHYGSEQSESASMRELALCDVSALFKLGIKGRNAETWLRNQSIPIPEEIYAWQEFENGLIIRVAQDEFFLEDSFIGGKIAELSRILGQGEAGVYRVERQDTGLLLSGNRSQEVLAQTCSYPFNNHKEKLVMTRVALVSCSILPMNVSGVETYRIWFNAAHGIYLWNSLTEIVEELEGKTVGVAAFM